jgi:hypothetical protein
MLVGVDGLQNAVRGSGPRRDSLVVMTITGTRSIGSTKVIVWDLPETGTRVLASSRGTYLIEEAFPVIVGNRCGAELSDLCGELVSQGVNHR